MTTTRTWRRVSRREPCPICRRPDWCGVTPDGSAACCMRVESPKRLRNGGWLHRLRDDGRRPPASYSRTIRLTIPPKRGDLANLAERYRAALTPAALERFAASLGLSADSLRRLRVGWDGEAWTFPMSDAPGRVIGIRRRLRNVRKLSVTGGHEGLFIPEAPIGAGPLLLCEGPTDTAALLDLGFDAIGRPSCRGGVRLCCELARGRDAVVVADADEPGQRGAAALAGVLAAYCLSVRVVVPPAPHKDARAWRRAGATRDDLLAVISAATPIRLTVRTVRR